MGCDIHACVEYKKKGEEVKWGWHSFGQQFRLNRDYWMFGLLAKGVRQEFPESFVERGLPSDLGFTALNDNRILITEDGQGDSCTTLAKAELWAKGGCKIEYNNDGKATWVTHPDWHSHSWLTTEEFKKALDIHHAKAEFKYYAIDYRCVLAAMEHFESSGYDCRIVFWFDN